LCVGHRAIAAETFGDACVVIVRKRVVICCLHVGIEVVDTGSRRRLVGLALSVSLKCDRSRSIQMLGGTKVHGYISLHWLEYKYQRFDIHAFDSAALPASNALAGTPGVLPTSRTIPIPRYYVRVRRQTAVASLHFFLAHTSFSVIFTLESWDNLC
jgi:hypothetical protein